VYQCAIVMYQPGGYGVTLLCVVFGRFFNTLKGVGVRIVLCPVSSVCCTFEGRRFTRLVPSVQVFGSQLGGYSCWLRGHSAGIWCVHAFSLGCTVWQSYNVCVGARMLVTSPSRRCSFCPCGFLRRLSCVVPTRIHSTSVVVHAMALADPLFFHTNVCGVRRCGPATSTSRYG
jgi:hypothetical protein